MVQLSPTSSGHLSFYSLFKRTGHPSSIIHSRVPNTETIDNGVFKIEIFPIGIHSSIFVFDELY
jgi:hypothetical protein